MSAPPYMQWYVADYIADTQHLTRSEHGAYCLLLMSMWRGGGRLPLDDGKLANIAHCTAEEWAAMRDTMLEFFIRRGSILTHKKIEAVRSKYDRMVAQRSGAGKASAEKRANKNNGNDGEFVDTEFQQEGNNQKQNQKEKKEEDSREDSLDKTLGQIDLALECFGDAPPKPKPTPIVVKPFSDFPAFWAQYPRKVAKDKALPSYEKCLTLTTHAAIIDALMLQRDIWEALGTEIKFIPHATTWLNQHRFNDDLIEELYHARQPASRANGAHSETYRKLGNLVEGSRRAAHRRQT